MNPSFSHLSFPSDGFDVVGCCESGFWLLLCGGVDPVGLLGVVSVDCDVVVSGEPSFGPSGAPGAFAHFPLTLDGWLQPKIS